MRLLELTVRNFRGFGPDAEPLNLDADLVLFFGPNAYGKTSLSEAVEWLFYGSTKRRRRGDELNRTEYQGTFRNVHGGVPTEVVIRVRLPDGSERTLSRPLKVPRRRQSVPSH
jgi:recombinational DNA repair ATPase RecF